MAASTAIYQSLQGKVVLITGGAEGIAAATVELFCRQGSKVIFFDIASYSAETLIEKLKAQAEEDTDKRTTVPAFLYCDVTNLDQLKENANKVLEEYDTVDVLVNSAAATGNKSRTGSADVTPESWQFDLDVNLRHVFFLTQAIIPAMQKQGSGSIINMGSVSWRLPDVGYPAYMAAKAAIMGLTKTQSKEYGRDGIRINSVMPGAIATERQKREVYAKSPDTHTVLLAQQSLKRNLEPHEIAKTILFLASEESSAITGSSICVDGGLVSDV